MPLTDLIRYFNTADGAGESTLYPEGERAAAWHRGLRLGSLFQPIVDLQNERIVGHQASLTARQEDGTPVSSVAAYAMCETAEAVVHFDRLCRTLHALNFLAQRRHAGGYLQVPIHPRHLLAVQNQHGLVYEAILKRCGLAPEDIVLDIDAGEIDDPLRLHTALDNYRRRGYRLALRVPAGGELQGILELRPDILRADEASSADVLETGITVEVSNIETGEDFGLARERGFLLGLGSLFGAPQTECRATHSDRRVAYNPSSPNGAPT